MRLAAARLAAASLQEHRAAAGVCVTPACCPHRRPPRPRAAHLCARTACSAWSRCRPSCTPGCWRACGSWWCRRHRCWATSAAWQSGCSTAAACCAGPCPPRQPIRGWSGPQLVHAASTARASLRTPAAVAAATRRCRSAAPRGATKLWAPPPPGVPACQTCYHASLSCAATCAAGFSPRCCKPQACWLDEPCLPLGTSNPPMQGCQLAALHALPLLLLPARRPGWRRGIPGAAGRAAGGPGRRAAGRAAGRRPAARGPQAGGGSGSRGAPGARARRHKGQQRQQRCQRQLCDEMT